MKRDYCPGGQRHAIEIPQIVHAKLVQGEIGQLATAGTAMPKTLALKLHLDARMPQFPGTIQVSFEGLQVSVAPTMDGLREY